MKDLYTKITEILTSDADLRALVGYRQTKDVPIGLEGLRAGESEMTIRRGFQTEGKWKKLVSFYFQADIVMQDFSANIRDLPLVIAIYDRTSDLNLFDISERIIFLLDESNLDVSNLTVKNKVHSYGCHYLGQIQSPTYDVDLKSYMMSIRFSIKARKEL